MDIFFAIHCGLPREGPGDDASTRKALSWLSGLPPRPTILDIACGPGMQTRALAQRAGGHIVAVDTHQPFLASLKRQAHEAGMLDRMAIINASMFALPFAAQTFDAIWCEAAIYIIGFARGLRAWRRLLKPGGYVAVSELAWLRPNPPVEVATFWQAAYPGMRAVEENVGIIRATGYRDMGYFVLPPDSWWDGYYRPMEARIPLLRDEYRGDVEANQRLDEALREIELYRAYADWYGYVFYVMQAT